MPAQVTWQRQDQAPRAYSADAQANANSVVSYGASANPAGSSAYGMAPSNTLARAVPPGPGLPPATAPRTDASVSTVAMAQAPATGGNTLPPSAPPSLYGAALDQMDRNPNTEATRGKSQPEIPPQAPPTLVTANMNPQPVPPAPPPVPPPSSAPVPSPSSPPALDPLPTPPTVSIPPAVVEKEPAKPTAAASPTPPPPGLPIVTTTSANAEADKESPKPFVPTIRMMNSKRISLRFEVKDLLSSGVSTVELWCTQDMKTWRKCETAPQNALGFVIDVKDEGIFGFTLVVRNGAGLATEPRAGDLPQVWVLVDVTKPSVQLDGVEMGHANSGPVLTLRWTAKDRHLGPKPITLAYAERPEGPWLPFAPCLANTGRYEWHVPSSVPRNVLLRVEAADLAGNVGAAQTSNALQVEATVQPVSSVEVEVIKAEPAPPKVLVLPPPPVVDPSKPSAAITNVDVDRN